MSEKRDETRAKSKKMRVEESHEDGEGEVEDIGYWKEWALRGVGPHLLALDKLSLGTLSTLTSHPRTQTGSDIYHESTAVEKDDKAA